MLVSTFYVEQLAKRRIVAGMRRETDFVLEQAAWPAMLLEGNGRICRANHAARRIFDLPVSLPAITVAAMWDDESETTPEQFLRDRIAGGTAPLKLRIAGGAKADFVAHGTNVARDGHLYVVLQLFKESGAAFPEFASAPPAKSPARTSPSMEPSRTAGGVWTAVWPVLMVDSHAIITRANPAAERLFGARKGVAFPTICGSEDAAKWSTILTQNHGELKLRLEMGATAVFRLQCCPAEEPGTTLVQIFAAGMPAEAAAPGSKGEEDFLLQNAEWPALVVKKSGAVTRSNQAAVRAFGPLLEKGEQSATAIWSAQNKDSALNFLSRPAPESPVLLTFNLKSGLPGVFMVQMCDLGTDHLCLLQLLKEMAPAPAIPPKSASAPLPTTSAVATTTAQPPAATASESLAHKQKLDCALQLARSVALDFNNALTSILGHASLLLSKADPNHPWRNSLSEIEKSASKAAEVANDLAAFSRQEKDTRVHMAGNMNTLVERGLEAFKAGLQKPVKISISLERKLFAANFDDAKMQQAMIKLLDNAVEAIQGEGKITVTTGNLELAEPRPDSAPKLPGGNYVCIEVSDTGAGIPPEVMPRIFEPFFTTKGSRHRGLGLAWVYGIVTNHGGAVTVNSESGKGASVKMYLPATKKIVRSAPATATDLSGTQTILFVDDEDLLLTMGQMILSSYGYTVLTANSGEKALEIFSRANQKIDLVVTDVVMPNMSGRELSEKIQALAPGTRILWSSGYVRSNNPEEQERYLQKPFSSQDLLRKVKQVLAEP